MLGTQQTRAGVHVGMDHADADACALLHVMQDGGDSAQCPGIYRRSYSKEHMQDFNILMI